MDNNNWIEMPDGGVDKLPDEDIDGLYVFVDFHYGESCNDYVGKISQVKAFRKYTDFTHYLLLPTPPTKH